MARGSRRRYRASSRLDLSSGFDRAIVLLFLASLLGCGAGAVALHQMGIVTDLVALLPIFTLSFALPGLVVYLDVGRWHYLLGLLALAAVMVVAGLEPLSAGFVVYAVLGGFGVMGLVAALQKRYFYDVMSRIEALGLKGSPDLRDRLISGVFSIREDTDTRNLTMEQSISRNRLPWGEMSELMLLGAMLGTFMWVYLSLNPVLLASYGLKDILLIMFLLTMYVPLLVMPWAIFRSLDVRISSEFRDFHLFSGVRSTLRKAVLPVLGLLVYALAAVNRLGADLVLGCIAASALLNLLVVGATALIYYLFFEKSLVEAIAGRWSVFRPMPILSEVREREGRRREELPGTPRRVYEESMEMDFTPYR